MGNTNLKASELNAENFTAVSKGNFVYHFCIGKGGFGKVWRVERKKAKQYFAMKEMSKARIITKRSVKSVINERQILAQLKNPFIVNMYYAFQDRENLYLVMDYLSGGDLRYHICRNRRFDEEVTRFFVACLVSGLEYFHEKNIIHRDIKPENLVIETDGYLRITDFGIARVWREDNAQDTSGTPGYMAPEVMCRQNHTMSVDFFAVGVMAYECMFGRRPYIGKSRKEIRDHILSKQIQIKRGDIPRGWSVEAADFVNKMIQRKPQNRLGSNGASEVKNHPWLRDYPWDDLLHKRLKAPFIPPQEDNFDQKNINEEWRDVEDDAFKQNFLSLRSQSTQNLFAGYYYDHEVANFTEKEAVQRSGLNEVIMQTIHQLEQKSQMQDPQNMATSSSAATITGVYTSSSTSQLQKNKFENGPLSHQQSIQSVNNVPQANQIPQKILQKQENASNRRQHQQHQSFTNQNSQSALSSLQQSQNAQSTYHAIPMQSIQNNYVNEASINYAVQKQGSSNTQRPMSNTASSTLNQGVVTSQNTHSHSNSYSQSNSNKHSIKHTRHGSAKAANTMSQSNQIQGSSSLQLQQQLFQQTNITSHVKHNSMTLSQNQANTLSQSYLHNNGVPVQVNNNGNIQNSAQHKRNMHQLTQPTNYKQHPNSNQVSTSPGKGSHYQNGAQTILVSNGPNQLSMSHNYNQGLGLSVKQSQLRHSQHFQQQMLQSQQIPLTQGVTIQQQSSSYKPSGQKTVAMGTGSIKIYQPSQTIKQYAQQQFAKSECPTPKSREIENRVISNNQQKFFTRKGSGINQAQVQNIQMTGLLHQGGTNLHHIQAQMHVNQPINQTIIQPNHTSQLSRQVVQSQAQSRRQSGRSNDLTNSVQHVSLKATGIMPEESAYVRNGQSNRQKVIVPSYQNSSLSFNKSPNLNQLQQSVTIHQTYNGTTTGGLNSHNSSIHSSHMKTRSPGNSQLSTVQGNLGLVGNAPQMILSNGSAGLTMHQFHPSNSLHQKNSISLGQYETTKIRRNNLVGPGTEKRKRTTKFK